MKKEKDFSEIIELLNRLHRRLVNAHSYFQICKVLNDSKTYNEDSSNKKDIDKNVDIMNMYGGFFICSIEAHRRIHLIELAKFFDIDPRTLSIGKIINYIQNNKSLLTVKEFENFNKDRVYVENLVSEYEGIKNNDLKNVRSYLSSRGLNILEKKKIDYSSVIGRLKKYRDQFLAHDCLEKEKIKISLEEIEDLFELAREILNLLSSKINDESWAHFHLSNGIDEGVKFLLEDLKKANDKYF